MNWTYNPVDESWTSKHNHGLLTVFEIDGRGYWCITFDELSGEAKTLQAAKQAATKALKAWEGEG